MNKYSKRCQQIFRLHMHLNIYSLDHLPDNKKNLPVNNRIFHGQPIKQALKRSRYPRKFSVFFLLDNGTLFNRKFFIYFIHHVEKLKKAKYKIQKYFLDTLARVLIALINKVALSLQELPNMTALDCLCYLETLIFRVIGRFLK